MALISRGASLVEYWHWHTLHFGAETYWGGVLPHSGTPGRTFAEITLTRRGLGAELDAAGGLEAGLTPDADVTLLYAAPNKWLMQKYPSLAHDDSSPDGRSYEGLFEPFYRGAFNAGLQARIVHQDQVVGESAHDELADPATFAFHNPLLVVPGLYLASDEILAWLGAYAASGGHLVLGPRTGYADEEGRAREETMPAALSDLASVRYEEFSNISGELPVAGTEPADLALGSAGGSGDPLGRCPRGRRGGDACAL